MDIRQITGFGGVERTPERSARTERPKSTSGQADGQSGGRPVDGASISEVSRETAASVDPLTERARREDPERRDKVAIAKKRLESGDLTAKDVYRAVAKTLLESGEF